MHSFHRPGAALAGGIITAFSARRIFRGCNININIQNPTAIEKGAKSIRVDNAEIDISAEALIPASYFSGKKKASVSVVMGESKQL